MLIQYLRNKVSPHSMIFSGPASTSKRSFALGYAKSFNCLEFSIDFCDRCHHCDQINRGLFPDVIGLVPDGRFYKKEQISFLIDENSKRPMTGDKKIFLLQDAHLMNENAANAFLKILEEPSPSSMFILITHNLNGLLSTIKSRCQILKFSPPSQKEIFEYLINNGTDERRARLVSHLSLGTGDPFNQKNLNLFLDRRSHALSVLIKLVTKNDIEDVLLDLYGRSRNREKFLEYFNELIHLISLLLRDIMILKINYQSDYIINIDLKDSLMNLAEYMTDQKVLFLIYRMELLFRDIQRNLNIRVLILEFIRYYTQKEVIDV